MVAALSSDLLAAAARSELALNEEQRQWCAQRVAAGPVVLAPELQVFADLAVTVLGAQDATPDWVALCRAALAGDDQRRARLAAERELARAEGYAAGQREEREWALALCAKWRIEAASMDSSTYTAQATMVLLESIEEAIRARTTGGGK